MDAKAILDVLMQSGMGRSQQRLERTAGGGNPLIDAAVSMLGGSNGGGGGAGALGGILASALGGGSSGGGGGALGNVLGSLLGGGGNSGGGAAGGLIGSLAKAAMSQMAGGGGGQAAASGFDLSKFPTGQMDTQRDEDDRARVMIRAMLTAAKADGQIDAGEQQRILGKINEAGADQETKEFIQNELRQPVDIESLAAEVDSPHMATEIYTASLFAIDIDTPGEQAYMQKLASRLGLPSSLVQQLHESLEVKGA